MSRCISRYPLVGYRMLLDSLEELLRPEGKYRRGGMLLDSLETLLIPERCLAEVGCY